MEKTLILSLLLVTSIQFSFCQKLPSSDNNDSSLVVFPSGQECLNSSFKSYSYESIEDTVLRDFFYQIDTMGFYEPMKSDTLGVLTELLYKAERDSNIVCLLPFYRLLDTNANEVYKNNCNISSRVHPYSNCCSKPTVRYAMIFYFHFTLINPIKLNDGEVIAKARIRNKDTKEYYSLTKEDYDKMYERYYYWLEEKVEDKDLKVDPLPLNFRWDVEIELKGTGWYRKNENYEPIRFTSEPE